MLALEAKLPERYWVPINSLLVPFGKHICTGRPPQMLDLPGARHVPAGGGDAASLNGHNSHAAMGGHAVTPITRLRGTNVRSLAPI